MFPPLLRLLPFFYSGAGNQCFYVVLCLTASCDAQTVVMLCCQQSVAGVGPQNTMDARCREKCSSRVGSHLCLLRGVGSVK